MEIVNKIEVKLEKYKKCQLVADIDCPVTEIYNYACELIAFSVSKMKENQPQPIEELKQEDPKPE